MDTQKIFIYGPKNGPKNESNIVILTYNLQATGNDTCVISRCVRYDIIFIRDQVWSRIKTSNSRENPQDFLGVIKNKPCYNLTYFFENL
jgi:hypothetical protein